jgi:hypothetical protein
MEHPFIETLEEKSIEELQNTLSGLYNKMTYAHRMGNMSMVHQIQMVIESYKKEYNKKMSEMMSKQNLTNKINID